LTIKPAKPIISFVFKELFDKKIILSLLCALACLGIIIGCGQNSSSPDSDSSTTTTTIAVVPITTSRIVPSNLTYLGAFKLPYVNEDDGEGTPVSWQYGGTGATFYPSGDPSGPADGFPGSIYAIGHDQTMYVSEISIPVPVISTSLADLNTAGTLRDFANIRTGVTSIEALWNAASLRYSDLAYLPTQAGQSSEKIYACWGAHAHSDDKNCPTHMWCDLDLTHGIGAWRIGPNEMDLLSSSDLLCEIPVSWANSQSSTSGKYLATGRYKEGGHAGQGPSVYAIAPWNDVPVSDDTIMTSVHLLGYSGTLGEGYDYGGGHTMTDYNDADEWNGMSWLRVGTKEALIFVGTKGHGTAWYGFSDGSVYNPDGSITYTNGKTSPVPVDGNSEPYYPDPPNNERSFWSTSFEAEMIFYDPADLAAVARGTKYPYEPQPYATLSLDQYLYNIDKINDPDHFPVTRNRHRMGACCYDSTNHLLYVFEYRGEPDNAGFTDSNPIVHVFRVN